VGDPVNLEVDVMAKYAERLLVGYRESASSGPTGGGDHES
jgi:riboflavin synthase alpha subunit